MCYGLKDENGEQIAIKTSPPWSTTRLKVTVNYYRHEVERRFNGHFSDVAGDDGNVIRKPFPKKYKFSECYEWLAKYPMDHGSIDPVEAEYLRGKLATLRQEFEEGIAANSSDRRAIERSWTGLIP